MRATYRWLGACSTMLVLSAVADAQAPQGAPGEILRTLSQLDADGDRSITRGEVPESARESFDLVLKHGDSDGNGQMSDEEMRALLGRLRDASAAGGASIARRFAQMDRDGDGMVSREEFRGPELQFTRLDANGDGKLTREEASAGPRAGVPKKSAAPEPKAETPLARRLSRLDRNGDGRIARDEYRGPAPLFDRLDVNRDDRLDTEELRQAPQR